MQILYPLLIILFVSTFQIQYLHLSIDYVKIMYIHLPFPVFTATSSFPIAVLIYALYTNPDSPKIVFDHILNCF